MPTILLRLSPKNEIGTCIDLSPFISATSTELISRQGETDVGAGPLFKNPHRRQVR